MRKVKTDLEKLEAANEKILSLQHQLKEATQDLAVHREVIKDVFRESLRKCSQGKEWGPGALTEFIGRRLTKMKTWYWL